MTNQNLIPRKEVEKMINEKIKLSDSWYVQPTLEELLQDLSQIESVITEKVTRVEVIDEHGRAWTTYNSENVNLDFQDDNKTLKVFLKSNKPPPPIINKVGK